MGRMGSAPASCAALPGLQQGSGGNNPHSAQECAGMAAGSHLLWVKVVGSDANKSLKICCGKPFLFQSGLHCAVQRNGLKILNVQINTGKVLWHPPDPSSVDPLVLQLLNFPPCFPMVLIHLKWWSFHRD